MLPPFEKELARAHTLPARAYTDAAIFAAERERIFRRTWQPVAALEDVAEPGTFTTAEIGGAPIVIVRPEVRAGGAGDTPKAREGAGELRGFYNVCRHRAGPVAIGKGARKSLTCRYHGWTYALDGRLMTTPDLGDIQDFDRACNGLQPVRAEAWGPFVFANLDDGAARLATVLGGIRELPRMKRVAVRTYDIACNWKTYVDNYLEGYHLPTVHPGLFAMLDYGKYRVETFDMYGSQIAPMRAGDGEALYYWVFPNFMLNIYPDNVSLNVIVPVAPERTLTIFEWYRTERDDDATAKAVAWSDEIQREDIEICEAVQKGLASGAYDRGRFSPKRENGVHHFQGLVHRFLDRA